MSNVLFAVERVKLLISRWQEAIRIASFSSEGAKGSVMEMQSEIEEYHNIV